MCEAVTLGIISGVAQAGAGIIQQNAAHRNAVAQVNRSNAIARQKYLNDITISAFNDQRKGEVFTAQLQADAASRQAYYKQREINQLEANRSSETAQQELREKVTEAMFKSQEGLAKAIEAQGTILASGQQAGQSMMLQLADVERQMGFKNAQLNASVFDATKAFGIKQFGVDLDQYGADTRAYNSISTTAAIAPSASFKTVRPIEQAPPEKPSILGPLLGGISAGVGVYGQLSD
jgi:hypothetical protein|tara:strand:+ start:679 stop:1383 length:705 start_codon:yes stop_codon:yes gene_type:complete